MSGFSRSPYSASAYSGGGSARARSAGMSSRSHQSNRSNRSNMNTEGSSSLKGRRSDYSASTAKPSFPGSQASAPSIPAEELFTLFLTRLGEKYDPNGLRSFFRKMGRGVDTLRYREFAAIARDVIPGANDSALHSLALRFDVDGNGEVSVSEFVQVIRDGLIALNTSPRHPRNAAQPGAPPPPPSQPRTPPETTSAVGGAAFMPSPGSSAGRSEASARRGGQDVEYDTEDRDLQRNVRRFLLNLKSQLCHDTVETRRTLNPMETLPLHNSALAEKVGRTKLQRMFRRHRMARSSAGDPGEEEQPVSFNKFCTALNTLAYAGQRPLSSVELRYIYDSCDGKPMGLADLLFRGETTRTNKFGFQQPVPSALALQNPPVGDGPFDVNGRRSGAREVPAPDPDQIPLRMRYRHSRTGVCPPGDFDPEDVTRSAQLPPSKLRLEHVYGARGALNNVFVLSPARESEDDNGSRYDDSTAGSGSASSSPTLVVYSVAAVGVIHNVKSNTQRHYKGHDDDISALTVHPSLRVAASGQVGKRPGVSIWNAVSGRQMAQNIGKGFFERLVLALAFSPNGQRLAAVSADDHHMVGVFDVSAVLDEQLRAVREEAGRGGCLWELVSEAAGQNGAPPQIYTIKWSPVRMTAISNPAEEIDMLVTVGRSSHIKFWEFNEDARGASLLGKNARLAGHPHARELYCVEFIPGTQLILTGGENGCCWIWRGGVCVSAIALHRGPLLSLHLMRNTPRSGQRRIAVPRLTLFTGGADGTIRRLDAEALAEAVLAVAPRGSRSSATAGARGGPAATGAGATQRGRPRSAARSTRRSTMSGTRTSRVGGGGTGGGGAKGPRAPNLQGVLGMKCEIQLEPVSDDPNLQGNAEAAQAAYIRMFPQSGQAMSTAKGEVTGGFGNSGADLPGGSTGGGRSRAAQAQAQQQRRENQRNRLGSADGELYDRAAQAEMNRQAKERQHSLQIKQKQLRGSIAGGYQGTNRSAQKPATQSDVMRSWMPTERTPGLAVMSLGCGPVAHSGRNGPLVVGLTNKGTVFYSSLVQLRRVTEADLDGGGTVSTAVCYALTRSHFGPCYGLAAHPRGTSFATCGEDSVVWVWDASGRRCVARLNTPVPARSVAYSPDGEHLAVGMHLGALAVYSARTFEPVALIRDREEIIDDLKFSPNGEMLAVGSHDNFVDIYDVRANYRRVSVCSGHTSYITHVDWSADSRVLVSNCGAYEILFWDPRTGKQILSSTDTLEADTVWHSVTCVLGFSVMGIWPPATDGTDVNALHAAPEKNLVVTGDDFGCVKLFHFPCVVNRAPFRTYRAHSSHVMNIRFLRGNRTVISVGGNDKAVCAWRLVET